MQKGIGYKFLLLKNFSSWRPSQSYHHHCKSLQVTFLQLSFCQKLLLDKNLRRFSPTWRMQKNSSTRVLFILLNECVRLTPFMIGWSTSTFCTLHIFCFLGKQPVSNDRVFLTWNDLTSDDLRIFESIPTIEDKRWTTWKNLKKLDTKAHINFRNYLQKSLNLDERYPLSGT